VTRIVVDSTCDIPAEQMQALNIVSVPLTVHFGEETFRDKIDLDENAFFRKLESATQLPTTSQPTPAAFQEAYSSIPKEEPVISIHIAHQLSGTLQSAQLAAQQLPDHDIRLIDSGSVSWGAGLLVMVAADHIKAGKNADDIEKDLLERRKRLRLVAVLDTLKYVIMGGRVSRAQGMIGGLLRVKPIMLVHEGKIQRQAPARTWGQAYEKVLEDIQNHGGAERIAVIHAKAPEAADTIRAKLEAAFPGVEIYEGTIGPVVGTHAGPGAAGVAYLARRGDGGSSPGGNEGK